MIVSRQNLLLYALVLFLPILILCFFIAIYIASKWVQWHSCPGCAAGTGILFAIAMLAAWYWLQIGNVIFAIILALRSARTTPAREALAWAVITISFATLTYQISVSEFGFAMLWPLIGVVATWLFLFVIRLADYLSKKMKN